MSDAERARRYRARNRAIDIPTTIGEPTPLYAAGSPVTHLSRGDSIPLCGKSIEPSCDGKPPRSRWCVSCAGHYLIDSGQIELLAPPES